MPLRTADLSDVVKAYDVRGVVPDQVIVDPLLPGEGDTMLEVAIEHVLSQR